jgi:DNA polymerase (family 10)
MCLLVSDHTEGLRFGGLGAAGLEEQSQKINRLRVRFPDLAVFHGAEVNIGLDGKLDLDDLTRSKLDFTVAGVHSNFHLARKEQTARLIEGLRQPSVRVLAHPTGRRIGIRPSVDVDMEDVVAEAIISGVVLECNGHRDRLDLPTDWVAHAAARGAVLAANSDAQRIGELRNIENGVATLQRAGVTLRQVINTFDLGDFTEWLGESSGRSMA